MGGPRRNRESSPRLVRGNSTPPRFPSSVIVEDPASGVATAPRPARRSSRSLSEDLELRGAREVGSLEVDPSPGRASLCGRIRAVRKIGLPSPRPDATPREATPPSPNALLAPAQSPESPGRVPGPEPPKPQPATSGDRRIPTTPQPATAPAPPLDRRLRGGKTGGYLRLFRGKALRPRGSSPLAPRPTVGPRRRAPANPPTPAGAWTAAPRASPLRLPGQLDSAASATSPFGGHPAAATGPFLWSIRPWRQRERRCPSARMSRGSEWASDGLCG